MKHTRTSRYRIVAGALGVALAGSALVAVTSTPATAAPVTVQILATNDFHGRLINEDGTGGTSKGQTAGAAILSGAVKQLRTANPNTVFAAAGDLIGASTFESFIQRDKPTLDALDEAGLDVSAAGNHEFDAGYADLANRVMAPYDATTNPEGGADWQYLAANVRKKSDNTYALPDVAASPGTSDGATWYQDFGSVRVGFVGAVTEDLPSLVSPDGISAVNVTSIVTEVNAAADRLTDDLGADVVVMLVHEGAADTTLASATDTSTAFGKIVAGANDNIDAIVSGHTHLAYNHLIDGRPVVSAGQYGMALNQLQFTVEDTTGAITGVTSDILYLKDPAKDASGNCICTPLYPADPAVTAIVDDAKAVADVLGAKELGQVGGGFYRSRLADGTTENRGGESTLGNLVAEVQRWATSTPEAGAAQIAFMNPGGLRADMVGNSAAGFPATLTYKQAAVVQPFANTLVNMKMTGAQVKKVLEQQWQRTSAGAVPTRPFLRMGLSKGFFYTYDAARPEGDRVTGMWLNGKRIDATASYSVTVNSFLAAGGDNFHEFKNATGKRDTGKVDLQAMVDYMKQYPAGKALAVDYQQHSVGLAWPDDAPDAYRIGQQVKFHLTSLAMTNPKDVRDAALKVTAGTVGLGSAKVDNTIGSTPFDESGSATVAVKLKSAVGAGDRVLTLTGGTTGSTFEVPIEVLKAKTDTTAKVKPKGKVKTGKQLKVKVKVKATGIENLRGKVKIKAGGKTYQAKVEHGKVTVKIKGFGKPGKKKVTVQFLGNGSLTKSKEVVKVKVKRG